MRKLISSMFFINAFLGCAATPQDARSVASLLDDAVRLGCGATPAASCIEQLVEGMQARQAAARDAGRD